MKKIILTVGKKLNKAEQKLVNGGGPDPISGGNGGGAIGSSNGGGCFCLMEKAGAFFPRYVECNSLCPDGSDPLEF